MRKHMRTIRCMKLILNSRILETTIAKYVSILKHVVINDTLFVVNKINLYTHTHTHTHTHTPYIYIYIYNTLKSPYDTFT